MKDVPLAASPVTGRVESVPVALAAQRYIMIAVGKSSRTRDGRRVSAVPPGDATI